MQIPVDIADIATAARPCDPASGRQMLDLLMSRLPFAASCLTVYDPIDRKHRSLASIGYDDTVRAYLSGRFIREDIIYSYYQRKGKQQRSLKWSEMPIDYYETYSVQGVFLPAGFREGITMCLYSRDGRYTGDLHISTDDPRFPSPDMMSDIVQRLQTILGNFTDILRDLGNSYAHRLKNGTGCVVSADGAVVYLPNIARMEDGLRRELTERFAPLQPRQIPEVFIYKYRGGWYQVFTGLLQGGARVIVADEYQVPFGLTSRELEIIEFLISGATNGEIASKSFVARSTISKHLENIFDKMDCNSRTSVVSMALSNNLRHLPQAR